MFGSLELYTRILYYWFGQSHFCIFRTDLDFSRNTDLIYADNAAVYLPVIGDPMQVGITRNTVDLYKLGYYYKIKLFDLIDKTDRFIYNN